MFWKRLNNCIKTSAAKEKKEPNFTFSRILKDTNYLHKVMNLITTTL